MPDLSPDSTTCRYGGCDAPIVEIDATIPVVVNVKLVEFSIDVSRGGRFSLRCANRHLDTARTFTQLAPEHRDLISERIR